MDASVSGVVSVPSARVCADIDVTRTPLVFEKFYAANGESIVRALAATIGDVELAGEAVDEAMTRALQRWTKISRYDNPAGWVYRVALNWSLTRKQRRRREQSHDGSVPEPTVEPRDRDDRFDAALAALSIEHRAVVVCRIYLDWSVAQTADALEVAQGTVKSRLARALALLKTKIEPEDT